jgi:TonB-linked SusC/RagA family outer membrane protein
MYKFRREFDALPPGRFTKILLTMKITAFLLLVALLQVRANSFAQHITLSENKAALNKVFDDIRQQTGYDFLVNKNALQKAKPVSIQVQNAELKDVLEQIFKDQPLEYKITDKLVLIKPKEEEPKKEVSLQIDTTIIVRGRVVDEKGQPVIGASVRFKNKGTLTDLEGKFLMDGVDRSANLVISYIGFSSKIINAARELGNVTLTKSNAKLDEIVVVGYETTTKRLSTGSISQVAGKELDQQPISNPIIGLQGRVTGAFITQSAGFAGAPINIVIRGQNSFAATSNLAAPLYIVDGVPFGSTPVEQSVGSFGTNAFSPLNTIDPNQIESISVLKDADATAIYGSRGANGVVLITTKKGKAGNTRLDVDLSSGIGEVTHTVPLLNTTQYLDLRRKAFANDGVTPNATNAPDLTVWDQHAYTNFPDLLMGNTQHQSKATLALSGGDLYTQFLLSGNYRHESTVLKTNTADNAEQFYLSLQHHSHDNKFNVMASVSYNADNNTIPNYPISSSNYSLPPNFPLYNPDGSLYFTSTYTNPLAAFNSNVNLKSTNLISNVSMRYVLAHGLDIKVNAGYNNDNVYGTTISPASSLNPFSNNPQISQLNNNYVKTYIAEPQLDYTHFWGKSRVTAILGGTWQETQTVQPYYVLGSFTNLQLATSLSALTVLNKSSNSSDYKYNSGFGRVEYEWDGKYLVSGNIRRDGSSRFGSQKPFGNFGSGALAWIFSKENFAKDLRWLSFGKLKTSYGSVGNDKTLQDYSYQSSYFSNVAYGPTTTLLPSRIQNPYLQWEVTTKFDAAIDLGFLQDRIFFSADVYRNRTTHMLGNSPLPGQDGFTFYSANLPNGAVVQNKGLELELSTTNIKHNGFTWNTSFNFTTSQNKLLSFPDIAGSTYANSYVVGQSLNLISVYHSGGFVNGIATAKDMNGDGIISYGLAANGKGDYVVAGNRDPKFYGGLDNTFSYKGFQLDFLFQFVKRRATRGDINLSGYPGMGYDIPASMLNLPLKYSATAGSPASSVFYYYTASDAAIEDASFIRLKNVSLAYNLPSDWAKRMKMAMLQVYVHGQNLATITKYKGLDPETLSSGVPTLRMIVAGIKTTF